MSKKVKLIIRRPKKRIPIAKKASRVMSDKTAYNRQKERMKLKKSGSDDE